VRKEGGIVILAGQGAACQLKVVPLDSGGIVIIWDERASKDGRDVILAKEHENRNLQPTYLSNAVEHFLFNSPTQSDTSLLVPTQVAERVLSEQFIVPGLAETFFPLLGTAATLPLFALRVVVFIPQETMALLKDLEGMLRTRTRSRHRLYVAVQMPLVVHRE
jgi:hypothetical protein